ncbi:MAG TPA: plastocyanin/azurin family copper-binding protein [Chthoniobacterales bacterium]
MTDYHVATKPIKNYSKFAFALCCTAAFSLLNVKADTITVQVGEGGLKFMPQQVAIHVGDTVQWTWASSGHSSTSGTPGNPDGMWDSGIQDSGFVFSYTFAATGTFPYFCTPHGLCCGMVGTVRVTQPIDTITITRALYNSTTMQLTVMATDSDPTATLSAGAPGRRRILGTMMSDGNGNYSAKFSHIATNPLLIAVKSNHGGFAQSRVRIRQ